MKHAHKLASMGGWTPAKIATWAWWDPNDDETVTLDGADNLTGVADLSGNSRDLTVFGNDASNFLRLVDFGNGLLAIDADASGAPNNAALRWVEGSALPADIWMFALIKESGPDDTSYMAANDTGSSSRYFGVAVDGDASTTLDSSAGAPAYWASGRAIGATDRNDLHDAWDDANGHVLAAANLDLSAWLNIAPFYYANTSFRFEGVYGETLMVEASVITTEVRQKIEGYLAHKAAIQVNLPSGHPYRAFAP